MTKRRRDDAGFFVRMAQKNLNHDDVPAALACLESAVERGGPSQAEQVRALASQVERRVEDQPALRRRARVLRRGLTQVRARKKPRAVPQPVSEPSSAGTLEVVRRLLVTPKLVDQLQALIKRPAGAPLSLPVAEVLGCLLAADLDVRASAELALDLVVRAVSADRGILVLVDSAPRRPTLSRAFHTAGGQPPEASQAVLDAVAQKRAGVVVGDSWEDPRFAGRSSIADLGARSILGVPVLDDDQLVAAIYMDAREPHRFGEPERELACLLARLVSKGIRNARRFDQQERDLTLARREARDARRRLGGYRLLGESEAMNRLRALIQRVGPNTHTVLIQGESGSGKELVARAVHAAGDRADGPFVAENLAAIPSDLLEAELFGSVAGAYTEAREDRPGLFRLAQGGTLFLDEVGELPLQAQQKLLRVLQERELRPVGGTHVIPIDVRVVAATNRDLQAMVKQGRFRSDLYFRLAVMQVEVPPLRERLEDLPLLLETFVAQAAAEAKAPPPEVSQELLAQLRRHPWTGNVRELMSYATRLVLTGQDSPLFDSAEEEEEGLQVSLRLEGETLSLREARSRFDQAYVGMVLERCAGNVREAAAELGMNRSYLFELVKRLGLRDG